MAIDPRELLPRDKHDVGNARSVVALGYPTVAPVLPDLLEWLKDCNWPVSHPIGDFLATLPEQMAPLIWKVLRSDDYIWKYWCIARLISSMSPDIAEQFRAELTRLAQEPTPKELTEVLNKVSQEALENIWPSGS
jgi:hypothetical protein